MSAADIWFVIVLVAASAAIGVPLGLSDRRNGRN